METVRFRAALALAVVPVWRLFRVFFEGLIAVRHLRTVSQSSMRPHRLRWMLEELSLRRCGEV